MWTEPRGLEDIDSTLEGDGVDQGGAVDGRVRGGVEQTYSDLASLRPRQATERTETEEGDRDGSVHISCKG